MQFETCLIGGSPPTRGRCPDRDPSSPGGAHRSGRLCAGRLRPDLRAHACLLHLRRGRYLERPLFLAGHPSIHAGPVRGARVASSHSLPIARIRCTSGLSRAPGRGACFRATGEYRNRFAGTRRARIAPVPGRWRVPAPSLERLNACH